MKLAPLMVTYSLMSYPFLIVVIPPLRANSIAFWAVKPSAGFTFSAEVTITQPEIAYEWGKYTEGLVAHSLSLATCDFATS